MISFPGMISALQLRPSLLSGVMFRNQLVIATAIAISCIDFGQRLLGDLNKQPLAFLELVRALKNSVHALIFLDSS